MFISKRAYHRIKEHVSSSSNLYETGGILIGYKILSFYYIVNATVDNEFNHSQTSFVLNGAQHTKKVIELMEQYTFKPDVLGLWHSHICFDTQFSQQDKTTNIYFAGFLERNIISMIVNLHDKHIKMTTYEISYQGKEKLLSKKEENL